MFQELFERYGELASGADRKYAALRNILAEAILDGFFKPGDKLPADAELAEDSPFSLGTVQRAYGMLANEGLIERRRGAGSFVGATGSRMPDPWHCRFLAEDGEGVLPVYPRLLDRRMIAAPAEVQAALETRGQVGRIDRLLSIGGEFDVLNRFYAPRGIVEPLLAMSEPAVAVANFKSVLLREIREPIGVIAQTIQLVRLGKPEARQLRCTTGLPFMRIEATARRHSGPPIYFQELLVPEVDKKLVFESRIGPFNL